MLKWIRDTKWLPETLIAAALFLILGGVDLLNYEPIALLGTFSLVLSVFAFRRAPWFAAPLIAIGIALQIWLGNFPLASSLAMFVSVWLQAAFANAAVRTTTVLVALLGGLALVWFTVFESAYSVNFEANNISWLVLIFGVLLAFALNAMAFSLGRLAMLSATHIGTDADRAHLVHVQAKLGLEVARQTERISIARDLTELLVQRVSAVVSLSEGGSFAVKTQPESAERVMSKVLQSARAAQVELRRLYDMLHEEHALTAAPPKLSDVEQLVVSMRSLGYNAKISVDGIPYAVDEGAELCIFKIVLEGLENVKKHAVAGTDVTVDFFWTQDGLQVLIKDNGIETARRSNAPEFESLSSGYTAEDDLNALVEKVHGATLAVLNERAAIYEGTIEATRVPGVGFTLSALFPHLRAVAGK